MSTAVEDGDNVTDLLAQVDAELGATAKWVSYRERLLGERLPDVVYAPLAAREPISAAVERDRVPDPGQVLEPNYGRPNYGRRKRSGQAALTTHGDGWSNL